MSPRPKKKNQHSCVVTPSDNIYTPEVDDKSKPLRRLWQMLTMLEEAPNGLTISEMAVRLQTSTRTIRRYLKCAEDVLGGDIETKKKPGEELRFMLNRQPIGGTHRGPTLEEKAAILVARHVLSAMFEGTFIGKAIESGAKAVCASASLEFIQFAERAASRIASPILTEPTSLQKDAFDGILRAICESKSVRMTIDTNKQGERAEVIFPYILDRDKNGEVILLYFSCKEDLPAAIPIRRIRTAKLGETQFVFPENFDRDEHLRRALVPPEKKESVCKSRR